jgi:transcriptional antiterminator NusG
MLVADVGRVERLDAADRHCHRFDGRVHVCDRPNPDFYFHPTLSTMRNQWFIIQTLSGQENKVKESIEKRVKTDEMQDYVKEVLVPMEKVVEVRNQKKTVSSRKLWPGYVFVDMVLLDENNRIIEKPWYFIKETQGVIGFVGGEPPVPTPSDEVESIKVQISTSEETEKPKVNFAVGETIKINNGPFLNFSGVIEEIDPDRGKLKVTVNIFGRNTPVELEYWQVEKA